MEDVLRSQQFDDIYFSVEGGLSETRHVFIQGNNLPDRWQEKERFTIAETGFGTGLNFFSAWKLFEETTNPSQKLHFISFEKYPLQPKQIEAALAQWAPYFEGRIEKFLPLYPVTIRGFHRIQVTASVALTLIIDDVNTAISELDATVDCWFLDGFTPSKNPDMWSDTVFSHMARLSAQDGSFASFTAAGFVRRGLEAKGFTVQKVKGFGHKRDMIVGTYTGITGENQTRLQSKKTIAIIGGGLAGTSMAYCLRQQGYNPVIYERNCELAQEGSGNHIGFYNPRFTAQFDEAGQFYAPAYAAILNLLRHHGNAVDYCPNGALHLINSEEKKKRFESMLGSWQWPESSACLVTAQEACTLAGIEIDNEALYLKEGGSLNPKKLCAFYANDCEIRYNQSIQSLDDVDADIKIICSAASAQQFEGLSWLPVQTVRGQVTYITPHESLKTLQSNIHYGGYLAKGREGNLVTGATFQPWLMDMQVREQDNIDNLNSLKQALPILTKELLEVNKEWVGFRCAAKDRYPIVGQIPNIENTYTSVAFGSHGIVGTLKAAEYITSLILEEVVSLPLSVQKALSPQRFINRAQKKGQSLG